MGVKVYSTTPKAPKNAVPEATVPIIRKVSFIMALTRTVRGCCCAAISRPSFRAVRAMLVRTTCSGLGVTPGKKSSAVRLSGGIRTPIRVTSMVTRKAIQKYRFQ